MESWDTESFVLFEKDFYWNWNKTLRERYIYANIDNLEKSMLNRLEKWDICFVSERYYLFYILNGRGAWFEIIFDDDVYLKPFLPPKNEKWNVYTSMTKLLKEQPGNSQWRVYSR